MTPPHSGPAGASGDGLLAFERAVGDIQSGRPLAPVYLLFGPSHVAAAAVRDALLERLVPEANRALDAPVVDGANISWDDAVRTLQTASWSAGRRLLTVDEPTGFTPPKKRRRGAASAEKADAADESESVSLAPLERYLAQPAGGNVLLIRCRDAVDKRRKIVKAVQKLGGLLACQADADDRKRLPAWLERRARAVGLKLSGAQRNRLLNLVGDDLDRLAGELDKLAVYLGAAPTEGRAPSEAEFDAVVSPTADARVFDLVDDIGMRRPERAAEKLPRLWAQAEAPLGVLALLASQFRIMRQGAALLAQGVPQGQIASRLGQNPYRVQNALRQARNFSPGELTASLEKIWETEWQIKSGRWNERAAVTSVVNDLARRSDRHAAGRR